MNAQVRYRLAEAFRRRGKHDHLRALASPGLPAGLVVECLRYLMIPPH